MLQLKETDVVACMAELAHNLNAQMGFSAMQYAAWHAELCIAALFDPACHGLWNCRKIALRAADQVLGARVLDFGERRGTPLERLQLASFASSMPGRVLESDRPFAMFTF